MVYTQHIWFCIRDWLWENPPVMHKDNYLGKHNWIFQSVISVYPEGLKLQACNLPHIRSYIVKYELTAYKQFLQLICLCKPLIKWLTWSHVSALECRIVGKKLWRIPPGLLYDRSGLERYEIAHTHIIVQYHVTYSN